ncbi:MAG: DNA-3-methyladenine glycosylase family protein [Acidimicrobiia bacterium]
MPAAPPSLASFNRQLGLATADLAGGDPVMAELISAHGPCELGGHREDRTHFAALCQSVVYQQLAGRAAAAIYGRFCDAVGGEHPTAEGVLALGEADLRAVGLSGAKTRCLTALAGAVASGDVSLEDVERYSDEELISQLCVVHGIGRWTAEMFLMFQLWRLDVWPVGDFGVRKGYARAYGLAEAPAPKALMALGERFRPWRSVAAWYCWRAAETVVPA